ncbi:MAG: bifunctional ADP-heptose synthase [Bacteroidota bacterium]
MNKKQLQKTFDSFNHLNVLIIGDVMVDAYVWGNVTRVSPEAPVPIVAVRKRENRLGGAANVALNVQAMGANPILCSVVGVDTEGEIFQSLLRDQKLSAKGILKSRTRVTTTKTRVIGNNHHLIRIDEEMEKDISDLETEQLLRVILYLLKTEKVNVVIFEDYDKGLITPRLINKVVAEARKKKIPIVVDPKKKNFWNYKNVSLFKPNLKELKEGLKRDFDFTSRKKFQAEVDEFRERQNIDIALITMSEHGMYVDDGKTKKLIPAVVRNIADVSGAGDTVVSVAALCLAARLDPESMAIITNLAGGQVCEKVGVVPVNKKKLFREALGLISRKAL